MKICVYGAGAVGGCFGAWLAEAGADVTLIARGPHLAAMRDNGLTLIRDGRRTIVHPAFSSNMSVSRSRRWVRSIFDRHHSRF